MTGTSDGRTPLSHRPVTDAAARPRSGPVAAEVALLAVHLAVAWGFVRLYTTTGFLFDLVAFTVAATAVTAVARRLRLPLPAVALVELGGAVLVATWLLFPDTTTFWLPSGRTVDAATAALDEAAEAFRTVIAPTESLVGFQLMSGLALWAAVQFADWAAFRVRATVEALVPASILFVFVSVFAAGDQRLVAAVAFTATALAFIAVNRALQAGHDRSWLEPVQGAGVAALRRSGLALAAVAVMAGTVLAPLAPGYLGEPVIQWREEERTATQRDTVSPIVDIQGRLHNQTNREMFRVTTSAPAYWRLTSLNRFDGRIWSSSADFERADESLPSQTPAGLVLRRVEQRFSITALEALWAPAAFEARSVHSPDADLLWDPDSSTLIVDSSKPTSDGLTYSVASEVPVLDPAQLRVAGGPDPESISAVHLDLPADLPARVEQEARRATAGMATRFDQARALQDFFQSDRFTYSTDIPEGHGNDALVAFLESGVGYCEQFAGAYAAMARSLGIPARVAVGFTSGDRDLEDPRLYLVRGTHAHAWPEVYFPRIGWVPFEPTKGRAIPGAEAYTGLAAQDQADDPTSSSTTTTSSPTSSTAQTPTSDPAATIPPEVPRRGSSVQAGDPEPERSHRGWMLLGLAAVALSALAALLMAPSVRRKRRRHGPGPRNQVLDAWDDCADPIRWRTGLIQRPDETYVEFARRVGPGLGDLSVATGQVAELATQAAWAQAAVRPAEAERASALATQLYDEVREADPPMRRLRRRLDWREAFGVSSRR